MMQEINIDAMFEAAQQEWERNHQNPNGKKLSQLRPDVAEFFQPVRPRKNRTKSVADIAPYYNRKIQAHEKQEVTEVVIEGETPDELLYNLENFITARFELNPADLAKLQQTFRQLREDMKHQAQTDNERGQLYDGGMENTDIDGVESVGTNSDREL